MTISFRNNYFMADYGKLLFCKITTLYIRELINLKSASHINGNLNGSKELEHYAS